ncbi:hypothetical protein McanMca71_000798 [Microsporum canis]
MSEDILNFKRALYKELGDNLSATINFSPWANLLAFDVIANFVFGEAFGFLSVGSDFLNLIPTLDGRMRCINALGTLPGWLRPVIQYLPDSFWTQKSALSLQMLAKNAFNRRKCAGANHRKDMLASLLTAKSEDGKPLPEESIIAEAASFISGGSDSTSTTLTHFVDLVSRNDSVRLRLQDELDKAFPNCEENWVPEGDITGKLPYLQATLREVMRVRPASASGLERIVTEQPLDISGFKLPPGTLISAPTYTVHRNESIFKDPGKFDPDRWLGNTVMELNKAFAPFSIGPRGCMGKSFAWMELTKTIAMLFRIFDIARAWNESTALREGFFLKCEECYVVIKRR